MLWLVVLTYENNAWKTAPLKKTLRYVEVSTRKKEGLNTIRFTTPY